MCLRLSLRWLWWLWRRSGVAVGRGRGGGGRGRRRGRVDCARDARRCGLSMMMLLLLLLELIGDHCHGIGVHIVAGPVGRSIQLVALFCPDLHRRLRMNGFVAIRSHNGCCSKCCCGVVAVVVICWRCVVGGCRRRDVLLMLKLVMIWRWLWRRLDGWLA